MKESQSIVLKVQINCYCCARKVKKAIGKIEGVESISMDINQKKVTVTGNFDSSKLLKKVARTGRIVEMAGAKDQNSGAGGSGGSNKAQSTVAEKVKDPGVPGPNTAFPAEEAFLFSDDNATGCSVM